jgi:hypothetical protein
MTDKIEFILENVNELGIEDRLKILQMIHSSEFSTCISEKGSGCAVNLGDLDQPIIDKIHEFITKQLEEQSLDF